MKSNTALLMVLLAAISLAGAGEPTVCVVYFTGIGCPHCANTDPVVLGELPVSYNGSLVVIEYEIYKHPDNTPVAAKYLRDYGMKQGVPQIVLAKNFSLVGDKPILESLGGIIDGMHERGNPCPIIGNETSFSELDLNTLPGSPQIWVGDRVLAKTGSGQIDDTLLKRLISSDGIGSEKGVNPTQAESLEISGGKIDFNMAVEAGGWRMLWNGDASESKPHKVTGHWIWYYLDKLYYAVIALGILFLLYVAYADRKTGKR